MKKILGSLLVVSLLLLIYLIGPAGDVEKAKPELLRAQDGAKVSAPAVSGDTQKAILNTSAEISPWEKALSDAIDSSEDHSVICAKLIEMLKTASAPAQGVIAKHITNLANDTDFEKLIPYLSDQSMGKTFHEVVAADLLNRPDAIKLPNLLKVASQSWHPLQQKSLEFLRILTQEDAGEDWAQWEVIVKQKLNKPSSQ
ncbi:MAG: hypothetical protein WCO60_11115 [Verrucomicrobiota bacterium]